MRKQISFLLVMVMIISALTSGIGISAYAETDKEYIENVLKDITTKKPASEQESDTPEETEAETGNNADMPQTEEGEEEMLPEEKEDFSADEPSEDQPFDQRLVGSWVCYSRKEPEKLSDSIGLIEEIGHINGFFINGAVNSTKLPYPNFIAKAGEALQITARAGKMDYFEKLCEFTEKHPELFTGKYDSEYIEELEECSNVEISYKFFDITDKGDGDFEPSDSDKNYYKSYEDDGLLINIEADVQVAPLEKKHLEWEYKFYRNYTDSFAMKRWCLFGEWEDSMGNHWQIAPYFLEEDKDDEFAFPKCVYVLKDSGGKEHVTKDVYWYSSLDKKFNLNGYINFSFKTFDTPEFKVEKLSHDEVVLSSESGELTLKRTAEAYATAGKTMPK